MRRAYATPPGLFLMAGLPGPELDVVTRELIHDLGLCNFIIFSRNCTKGPASLEAFIRIIREECTAAGLPPPIIAVDQEGGRVQRLAPPNWPPLPSNMEVASLEDPEAAAREQARQAAQALASVGINLNLAPVLDLLGSTTNQVLRERCYGSDYVTVARLGAAYIDAIQTAGIGATAKHFPGIGGVRHDPHEVRPTITASRTELEKGLHPFRRAVSCGVAALMTSHVVHTALDRSQPATFSRAIAHTLAREELGFTGLMLTDDLEMGGATAGAQPSEAAVPAFAAGHDLLLICKSQDETERASRLLGAELERSHYLRARAEESLARLAAFRARFLT